MPMMRSLAFVATLHAGLIALPAKAAEEIRVGFIAPFSDTGHHRERFDAAVARELCEAIDKPCRTVEIKAATGMDDLLGKEVDVLVSYFDSISRSDRIAKTRHYARMPLAFVTRQDSALSEISPAALSGKSVAMGDMEGRSFVTTRLPKSVMSPQRDFLGALARNEADLAVARLNLAVYEMDMASGNSCCKVVDVLNDVASLNAGDSVLVRKSDKALQDLVDKAVGKMEETGRIKAAALAIFGFDVSPGARSDNPFFPTAPENSREIEPAIATRAVKLMINGARCSGVLVSGKAVLTAAHCFADVKGKVKVKPRQVSLYQNDKKLARKAARIVIHPDYRALTATDVGSSDIALLLLDDDGSALPPLRFLTGREAFLSTDMMDLLFVDAALYGYGNRDRKDARLVKSRTRLSLMVPQPGSFLGQSVKIFLRSPEFCQGDSGGGAFLAPGGVVGADEPPLLLGVASTTGQAKELCDDAGEIIRADYFAEWIAATLKEHDAD